MENDGHPCGDRDQWSIDIHAYQGFKTGLVNRFDCSKCETHCDHFKRGSIKFRSKPNFYTVLFFLYTHTSFSIHPITALATKRGSGGSE